MFDWLLKPLKRLASLATRTTGYKISETPGQLWAAPQSAAGVQVDEVQALSLSAVFGAVQLLGGVLGSLPLRVMRQEPTGAKYPATTYPTYRLLHSRPNAEMTSFTWRRTQEFHRLLWGNTYTEIQWRGNGLPAQLWPLEPWRVWPRRDDDGTLWYSVDGTRRLEKEDVLHVQLMSYDGVLGRSFVDHALESLGINLAAQEFSARFFGNGGRPGGKLKNPGNPDKKAREEFRESWGKQHVGPRNAHRVAVLWGGWDYTEDLGLAPEQMQLLDARRFGIEEVARWFNLPPHLLRDLSRATFSNIEHQGIDFVTYTLLPILTAYEQEYDSKLLNSPNLHAKHNVRGFLRGDGAARATYYTKMFGIGAMNDNEIREEEDMNPIGPEGDTYFVPVNLTPIARAIAGPAADTPEPGPTAPGDDQPDDPPQGADEPRRGQ